jgi:Cu-processing system ATP-binding protein
MIEIKGLNKSYDKILVLKEINLNFDKGNIIAIMGPNGSGKTTLLKSVLGLVKPDKGEIQVNGINTNGNCDYRKFIGYMPQNSCYPDNLKVRELIEMLKDVRGNSVEYDEELIEKLHLIHIYEKQIGTLSSGTKQRVSCSISFLFNQEIIILDEPTAGLDPVSSEIVKNKILDAKRKGKLIIITTHITSEVEKLADRVIFLLEGVVKIDSNTTDLIKSTGEPDLNKAIAKLMQGNGS